MKRYNWVAVRVVVGAVVIGADCPIEGGGVAPCEHVAVDGEGVRVVSW
ncbi:MAG: hypothetical protein IH624_15805, partial [Phycisphaerae bacterium]|nr:hypothetical protein [Phycisphaerae bacterium]